jgi:hypothetical protein
MKTDSFQIATPDGPAEAVLTGPEEWTLYFPWGHDRFSGNKTEAKAFMAEAIRNHAG